eukprot:GHVT01099729.1.p1 GENE.GHVT01099729.1~~GHVT01099729.1.p1  ORF type:complete len:319 (+),score=93.92 GHVT01099729.1:52-957(+)
MDDKLHDAPEGAPEGAPGDVQPWKVEFRTMDQQLTDYENAAFVSVLSILVQGIERHGWEFYLPMSLNDLNLSTANSLDGCVRGLFHFKPLGSSSISLASINTIFNGASVPAPWRHPDAAAAAFPSGLARAPRPGVAAAASKDVAWVGKSSEANDGCLPPAAPLAADSLPTGLPPEGPVSPWAAAAAGASSAAAASEGRSCGVAPRSSRACGLLGLCEWFVRNEYRQGSCSFASAAAALQSINYVAQRAAGLLPSNAALLRRLLRHHRAYRADARVPRRFVFDLCLWLKRLPNLTAASRASR